MKKNIFLLLLFFISINVFSLSACKPDEKKIGKESVGLRVFNGDVQIPSGFIRRLAADNDSVTFLREIKGSESVDPSYDIITKGSKKEDYYQKYVPKNNIYRMADLIKIDKFSIEMWTPKEGVPLADVFYTVIISDGDEFLGVSSEDLSLWKKIFDSYKLAE